MHVSSREEAYEFLNIQARELLRLSVEEQLQLFKRRHKVLALRYHPDRNPGLSTDAFLRVQAAYEFLVKPIEHERSAREFEQYFPSDRAVVDFPLEAVDLRLEVMIKEELQEILLRFSRLQTPDEKLAFAQQHQEFVAIASYLEANSPELSESRMNQVFDLINHFTPKLAQIWRTSMLEIFGEERLDDFSYREALGFGQMRAVTAYRKLFNPVKLLAAIIISLLAVIKAGYYQLQILLMNQFTSLMSAMTEGIDKDNILQLSWAVIVLVSITIAPVLVGYYYFSAYVILASLPLLDKLCRWVSCPTNTLVRPLLVTLGLQDSLGLYMPLVVPLILIGSVVGITFALAALPVVTLPMVELLLTASIVLSELYMAYFMLKVLYLSFKASIAAGFLQLSLLVCIIGLSLMFPVQADLGAVMDLAELAITSISSAVLSHAILGIIEQGADYFNGIIEKCPLPAAPVPDAFKTVINRSMKYSHYSHELFNTQEDAKPLAPNERSFWQQSQSFFGFCNAKSARPADEEQVFYPQAPDAILLGCD